MADDAEIKSLRGQHWLLGRDLLHALIETGVVPTMTQRVTVRIESNAFVTLDAEIALSVEQWEAIAEELQAVKK